ncbi:hypothetical protein RHODGE_RHODGE_02634 [Rhodoplanes serenus]|jgi:hypothetical protein|uniref:Uncharacterized protein n=1 Tax=Rhodoplanes serenus TaxID=200615 RepID=A0A447CUC4_9BRAD|nr:hypothetical protein RHODGE_RHODGE_02634 [Rhodoplanes serenus]
MLPVVLRRLGIDPVASEPVAGRFKTAPLFVPLYRSNTSIRLNARPPHHALARRQLGRLVEPRRRVS